MSSRCSHSSLAVEICAVCLDDLRLALAAAESKLHRAEEVLRKLVELAPSDYYPSPALTAIQTEADSLVPDPPK